MARIYDLVLVLGLFISASGCGLRLLDWTKVRASSRLRRLLFASGLGLGVLGYVPFTLGIAALLRPSVILGVYVLMVCLGLWGWRPFWRHTGLDLWRDLWGCLPRLLWPERILAGYLGLVAAINLLAALAPVVGVDELIYRLAAAKLYLLYERLLYIPSMVLHQQPQHVQMIQIWGLSLGSDSTAQVMQWGMGLLLLLALVDAARHEMPLAWALLGGAVFYSYSDVIVLSGRASPDLACALFMGLSVLAWLEWLESGAERWLVLAGVLAGLFAAGARLPGAYGAIALVLLVLIYGCRRFHWRPRSAAARGLGLGLLAFLVVMPWYAKSYIQTGNPVWPFFVNVFGARDWTGATYKLFTTNYSEQEIGRWLSAKRIVMAPWDLTMTPDLFHSGVVGPLPLATLPLALLVRLPRRLRWLLAACGVLGVLWYVSYPRLRAFIPGVALMSIVVSYLLWQLWSAELLPTWTGILGIGFAAAWLVVSLGAAVRFHLWAAFVTLGVQEEKVYMSQRLTEPDMRFFWFDDYQVLNRVLPAGSRLLIYDTRGYHLNFDYDYYTLIARRTPDPEKLRDTQYVADKVQELGSGYVLLWPEPQHGAGHDPSGWLEDSLRALCYSRWRVIYRSNTMIACQVHPPH